MAEWFPDYVTSSGVDGTNARPAGADGVANRTSAEPAVRPWVHEAVGNLTRVFNDSDLYCPVFHIRSADCR
jgi:hypothetical protein